MLAHHKYSFRQLLTSLFALLIICVGGLIGWLNYSQVSTLILSATDQLYEKVAEETLLTYQKKYNPVYNSLELLSYSALAQSENLEQRMQFVHELYSAINTDEAIVAIQVGYANGDYLILRKLLSADLRQRFNAPQAAMLVIDDTQINGLGQGRLRRVFLDQKLNVIQRNEFPSQYDPRVRPWYQAATARPQIINPYYFYFMRKVGTTVAMKMFRGDAVIATDITLQDISHGLAQSRMTPASELYLVASNGQVIASSEQAEPMVEEIDGTVSLRQITSLRSQLFSFIPHDNIYQAKTFALDDGQQRWQASVKFINTMADHDLYLFMFSPVNELLKEANFILWLTMGLMVVIILLSLPIIWLLSSRVSKSLYHLSNDSLAIMNFDFSASQRPHQARISHISEIVALNDAQQLMTSSISQFIDLIQSLSAEKNFTSLLAKIAAETLQASKADASVIYLPDDKGETLKAASVKLATGERLDGRQMPVFSIVQESRIMQMQTDTDCQYIKVDDDTRWSELSHRLNDQQLQYLYLPLRNRQSQFMGMIVLVYRKDNRISEQNEHHILSFLRAFAGFAAVSLESKQLLQAQQDLLDAFVKIIAGSIDAKSPYTGGHCQRVPVLTKMLAEAACQSEAQAFADYQLNDEQWQAVHIASWLHDCGKVTTPEHVVDKATKLQTIYDRIHEVRMRFEVLKRDAQIDYWQALARGADKAIQQQTIQQRLDMLDEDFAFVAQCNLGGEFMQDEDLQRLQAIAEYRWQRTLDDRLGVSWEEQRRMEQQPAPQLPVEEKLLDNKYHHKIARQTPLDYSGPNPWDFKMQVPHYQYDFGELYNLSIRKGTLTDEERFIINDHIIQTIIMLEQLPYPAHLKEVPILAGCHHETMDGRGYPRRLKQHEMPLTARMMAIADIFEALTAADRPYKQAKTLSESLQIMAKMRDENHIDGELFELFLRSDVYQRYARKYLKQEQIDTVNVSDYL